ncbi:MAG: agmatinase family protein [Planctomycetes bacterium]|nr:agmatinase family protein [Planctomycetota bacterium]
MTTNFDPNAAASPSSGIFGLNSTLDEAAVQVLPVPFDATASYRKGAWKGPDAIFRASKQVDLFDLATGRPYEAGIAMLDADPGVQKRNREASKLADRVIAAGGVVTGKPPLEKALAEVNALGAEVNQRVYRAAKSALESGKLLALVGGDHSTPFGAIRAALERYPKLGVLHFDAHADLRVAYEGFEWSHASIMENVLRRLPLAKLVQVGIRDFCEDEFDLIRASKGRVATLFDRDWQNAKLEGRDLKRVVREHLAKLPRDVYVSFDIDALDPTLCPNTGTPVPGGLSWGETMFWLDELVRAKKRVVALDLNEVNPGPDDDGESDSFDAMVGARLLYRMIATALATRR